MYIFNEEKKRLEPTETKCQYCEVGQSTDMEHNHFIFLYKENERTNIVVYRSVSYKKLPVGIPRCKSCFHIHLDAETKAARIAWGAALPIGVLSVFVWDTWGIFSLLGGIVIGLVGDHFLRTKLVRDKGIYTTFDGAKQNEAVQDLIVRGGWSLNPPTA